MTYIDSLNGAFDHLPKRFWKCCGPEIGGVFGDGWKVPLIQICPRKMRVDFPFFR
jgi:hypothetical protein